MESYLWSLTMGVILHEDCVAVDAHGQFQLMFDQFHVLGPCMVVLCAI